MRLNITDLSQIVEIRATLKAAAWVGFALSAIAIAVAIFMIATNSWALAAGWTAAAAILVLATWGTSQGSRLASGAIFLVCILLVSGVLIALCVDMVKELDELVVHRRAGQSAGSTSDVVGPFVMAVLAGAWVVFASGRAFQQSRRLAKELSNLGAPRRQPLRLRSRAQNCLLSLSFALRRATNWRFSVSAAGTLLALLLALAVAAVGFALGIRGLAWIGLALCALVVGKSARLWVAALRNTAPSAHDVLAKDSRAPVLFLRSFGDDPAKVESRNPVVQKLNGSFGAATLDEMIASLMKSLGPVVAIGQPGDVLPPVGAARLYVGDDAWQAEVGRLAALAGRVVVVLGEGAGLRWEYGLVNTLGLHDKCVFVMPPVDHEGVSRRWAGFVEAFLSGGSGQEALPMPDGVLTVRLISGKAPHILAGRFRDRPTYRAALIASVQRF